MMNIVFEKRNPLFGFSFLKFLRTDANSTGGINLSDCSSYAGARAVGINVS
jgi:hypothetical protein